MIHTDCFDEFPGLRELFEKNQHDRRDEILEHLSNNDKEYIKLVKKRADQSMVVRNFMGTQTPALEKYMDIVYEQELYELDAMYSQAFCDVIKVMRLLMKD